MPAAAGPRRTLKVGDRVRTTRDLEADVPENALPRGSVATVCELPADNGGFHAIETEDCVYDVRPDEVELIVPEPAANGARTKPALPTPTLSWSGDGVQQQVVGRAAGSRTKQQADVQGEAPTAHELWAEGVREYFAAGQLDDGAGAQRDAALRKFEASLDALPQPADGPLVARRALFCAGLLMDSGRQAEAMERLREATSSDPELWPAHVELCLALADAGDTDAVMEAASRAIVEGGYWTSPWQRPTAFLPGLHSKPFWDASDFPWVRELEKQHKMMQRELEQLMPSQQVMEESWDAVGGMHRSSGLRDRDALSRGDWREVVLFGLQEAAGERGQRLAPRTTRLVRRLLPEAVEMAESGAGEVILSALSPGTHVKPHCACSNHRLTAHLGLLVPPDQRPDSSTPSCGIRVGGTCRPWKEGRVLIFDDSFEHEVWNDSHSTRVVLLIRFWHPEITTEAQRSAALGHVGDALALAQRFQLLPPLRPAFPEPSEAVEKRLCAGADAALCPGCGRAEGADLSLIEPPTPAPSLAAAKRPSGGRIVMVSRCCGHVSK